MAFEELKKQFDIMWEDVKKEMVESEFLGYVCEKLSLRRLFGEKNLGEKEKKDENTDGKKNL